MTSKTKIISLVVLLTLCGVSSVYASALNEPSLTEEMMLIPTQQINVAPHDEPSLTEEVPQELSDPARYLERGRAVHMAINTLDLRKKDAAFIGDCMAHLDDCFFVFTSMTRYYQVSLDPMRLYPDVPQTYQYADDVNLATMLGIVHGSIDEKNSPFYPHRHISRIHALKIILASSGLLSWKEKFEMVQDLGGEGHLLTQKTAFDDVDSVREDMWWFPRYVNFSANNGIVDTTKNFRPFDPITEQDYKLWLDRALEITRK